MSNDNYKSTGLQVGTPGAQTPIITKTPIVFVRNPVMQMKIKMKVKLPPDQEVIPWVPLPEISQDALLAAKEAELEKARQEEADRKREAFTTARFSFAGKGSAGNKAQSARIPDAHSAKASAQHQPDAVATEQADTEQVPDDKISMTLNNGFGFVSSTRKRKSDGIKDKKKSTSSTSATHRGRHSLSGEDMLNFLKKEIHQ